VLNLRLFDDSAYARFSNSWQNIKMKLYCLGDIGLANFKNCWLKIEFRDKITKEQQLDFTISSISISLQIFSNLIRPLNCLLIDG